MRLLLYYKLEHVPKLGYLCLPVSFTAVQMVRQKSHGAFGSREYALCCMYASATLGLAPGRRPALYVA